MAIDTDIQSFSEYNTNITDINTKLNAFWGLVGQTPTAADTNKVVIERSNIWKYEGEERYNGLFQSFGNISGKVSLSVNNSTGRTAVLATITGDTFVTDFGENVISGVIYTVFLKQDVVGNHSFRWPYGASVLNSVDTEPDEITVVQFIKLPSGLFFIKCSAFTEAALNGFVIKEFKEPEITYPDSTQAPMSFTWTKAPAVGYGGTVSGLYSDWEIADDILYTNLLFSSYNNTSDLYSIQVVLTQAGTVYMRTRFGGVIGGDAIVSPWDEAVCELAGMGGGDRYWDQTVLCINANKYGWEGSRKIVNDRFVEKPSVIFGDTGVVLDSTTWAINFDGIGDYFTCPTIFNAGSGDFTLEFFLTYSGSSLDYPVFFSSGHTSWAAGAFNLTIDPLGNANKIVLTHFETLFVSNQTVVYNRLYHVTYVKKDGILNLYIDGVLDKSDSFLLDFNFGGSNSKVFVGAASHDASQAYSGKIWSMRLTTVARYTSDFQVDLTDPYFKTGNLWWTPEPKEIATDNFTGKDNWDRTVFCLNGYGSQNSTNILEHFGSLVSLFGDTKIGVTSNLSYINLDGAGDYLAANTFGKSDLLYKPFTIEGYVYFASSTVGFSRILQHGEYNTNNSWQIHLNNEGAGVQRLKFQLGSTGTLEGIVSNAAFPVDQIVHFAITRNSSNVISMWINGVKQTQELTSTRIFKTPSDIQIGYGNGPTYTTGRIYSLQILDYSKYTAAFTPDLTKPYFTTKPKVENWAETSLLINALDLPSGSTDIRDFKGNAISLYGDTKVAVDSNGLEYINFDGSGDYLQTAALASLALGEEFTIELFFSVSSYSTYYTIFDSRGAGEGTAIYFESPGRIAISNNSTVLGRTADGVVPFDSIAHLAMCRKSSSLNIYINGIFVVSISDARTMHSAPYYFLGRSTTGQYGNFKMYGVRVNNLKALYTSNFAVDLTNPYFPAYENALTDLWLDANDYSKITLATGVSKIVDKSGNMREAAQAATASQPALVQNRLNGLMALSFDGSNDKLSVSSSYNLNSPKYIISVCKPVITLNWQGLVEKWNSNQGWQIEFSSSANRGKPTLSSDASTLVAPSILNGIDSIIEGRIDGSNSFIGAPGNLTTGTLSSPTTIAQDLFIGGDGETTNVLGMDFYEIKIFLKLISDHFRNIIHGYLAHKWALTDRLPANHPYKTGFPTEDTTTDDYWYATVLCINGTDIIRPTEIVDSSRNNKITVYGDVKALIDSNNKPYINFDGSGDYLTSARFGDIPLETWPEATLEFFVSITSSGRKGLCGTRSPENGFIFGVSPSNKFWSFFPGEDGFSGTTTVVSGQLYHVALVFSGGFRKIYVNGVLEATSSIPTTTAGGKFYIGCEDSTIYAPITAKIYSMRVTKGIARYTEDFNVDLTNPYFPNKSGNSAEFLSSVLEIVPNSMTTNTAIDSTITITNNSVDLVSSPLTAMNFSVYTDYLQLNSPLNFMHDGVTKYTLDFGVYLTSYPSVVHNIIGNFTNNGIGTYGHIQVFIDPVGVLCFVCSGTGGTGKYVATPSGTIVLNQENRVRCIFDGAGLYVFVNGVLKGNIVLGTFTPSTANTTNARIGRYTSMDNYGLTGYISGIRITKMVADGSEIFDIPFKH